MSSKGSLKWVALVLAAFSVGCAENKLTRQNYDLVREGMSTRDEVRMTLGDEYTAFSDERWEFENEEEHLSIIIHFDESGKVRAKEWRDGKTGSWEGQDPAIDPNPPGRKGYQGSSTTTIQK